MKYDLEKRLKQFTIRLFVELDKLPSKRSTNHLASQLERSGSSVSLNYGETQSAESRKDFIHKLSIVLKELRETSVCLEILIATADLSNVEPLKVLLQETQQLIPIFAKSIQTARKNA